MSHYEGKISALSRSPAVKHASRVPTSLELQTLKSGSQTVDTHVQAA